MTEWLKDWGLPVVVVAGLVGLFVAGRPAGPQLPDQAPGFSIATVEGGIVSLESLEGRPAVVNFWATWCAPCKQEVPEFSAFAAAHPDVSVVGVVVDTADLGRIRATMDQWGMDYPVAIANDAMIAAYDIDVLPTTVILSPDGQVREAVVGMMSQESLEKALR